jgi:hypothetical protein
MGNQNQRPLNVTDCFIYKRLNNTNKNVDVFLLITWYFYMFFQIIVTIILLLYINMYSVIHVQILCTATLFLQLDSEMINDTKKVKELLGYVLLLLLTTIPKLFL